MLVLLQTTFFAVPKCSVETSEKLTPVASDTTVAPVNVAKSDIRSSLPAPKPGALIAQTSRTPFILLTTSPCKASPSISSPMKRTGRFS